MFTITQEINEKLPIENIYKIFESLPYTAILDSSLKNGNLGEYSIIAFDPFMVFRSKGHHIEIIKNGTVTKFVGDPLTFLRTLLHDFKINRTTPDIPFTCGCIGYFSYDICGLIEQLPTVYKEDNGIYDIVLGFYNNSVAMRHSDESIFITASSTDKISEIKYAVMNSKHNTEKDIPRASPASNSQLNSNFTKAEYCNMLGKVREFIRNGDIYQANLSQRFKMISPINPFDAFLRLRTLCPAPFSAYLNFEALKVISSSPERFIKINSGIIETRPIKGTRPRGRNQSEDTKLKDELLNSEKDRAELTMIVDLERNDLGKVCEIGSVYVERLFEIEEYANVFHLVSTIKGILKKDIDIIDCLKAAFPGGSITGAPKLRAMEIISELEPDKRGIYTGSIGYIGFDGNCDLNIAIRTIVMKGDEVSFNVGGGIVWDSVPEKEYEETLDKGKAMMEVLERS